MHNKGFCERVWKGWQNEGTLGFYEDACLGLGMFLSLNDWFWGAFVLGFHL